MLNETLEALLAEAMKPECTPERLAEIRTEIGSDMPIVTSVLETRRAEYNDTWALTKDETMCLQAGVDGHQAWRLIRFFNGKDLTPALTFEQLEAQGNGICLVR